MSLMAHRGTCHCDVDIYRISEEPAIWLPAKKAPPAWWILV